MKEDTKDSLYCTSTGIIKEDIKIIIIKGKAKHKQKPIVKKAIHYSYYYINTSSIIIIIIITITTRWKIMV